MIANQLSRRCACRPGRLQIDQHTGGNLYGAVPRCAASVSVDMVPMPVRIAVSLLHGSSTGAHSLRAAKRFGGGHLPLITKK
jgi:hypothetical protein